MSKYGNVGDDDDVPSRDSDSMRMIVRKMTDLVNNERALRLA